MAFYWAYHLVAKKVLFAARIGRKQDLNMHPILNFSKRMPEAESRFHSFELETLAILTALKRFRVYLQGMQFKIVTDCNLLALTLNKKCIAFSANNGSGGGISAHIPKGIPHLMLCTLIILDPWIIVGRRNTNLSLWMRRRNLLGYPTKLASAWEVIRSLEDYFRLHSRPRCIVSNREAVYPAEFGVLEDNNIRHIKVATGSPADGQVERVNKTGR
ncbi:hypothetical protein EVAR_101296_1 [Eumeta japonica]|uniref:Reverse transcriptase RNase H-like domain-containing protein n=1 Tax=Eumeta variegata TaxID=151549 RepID=A0A4C1SQ13_EUMVA|nr:hypothetical protein EVAR_101296_1 [Eumeta japonica]